MSRAATLPAVQAAMNDGHDLLSDIESREYVDAYLGSSLVYLAEDIAEGDGATANLRIERMQRLMAAHKATQS